MTIATGTMPADLAAVYEELWQETASLCAAWSDSKSLYGSQETIDLLNRVASTFFGDIQRKQQRSIVMHLCRMTDPAVSGGKPTLTIRRLPLLIADQTFRGQVDGLVAAAVAATAFAREWRNRQLAHTELPESVTGQPAAPFPRAAWQDIENALTSIINVMNGISFYFMQSETAFSESSEGGAGSTSGN